MGKGKNNEDIENEKDIFDKKKNPRNEFLKALIFAVVLVTISVVAIYNVFWNDTWKVTENGSNENGQNNGKTDADGNNKTEPGTTENAGTDIGTPGTSGTGEITETGGYENPESVEVSIAENITIDSEYLVGFTDSRSALKNMRAAGFDTSKYEEYGDFEIKGIYAGHLQKDSSFYENIVWLSESTELNTVVIDVKDDFGYITFDTDLQIVKDLGLTAPDTGYYYIADIDELLKSLHSKGIYCIARIVCFKETYFTDSGLVTAHPDWFIKTKDGEIFRDKSTLNGVVRPYAWLNPYNTEALDYIVSVASCAAKVGFDEICFDYMRTPTDADLSNLDFGTDALKYTFSEQIARFVRYACNRLKPLGVYVSGSVYGITIDSVTDSENLGQDYEALAKYLDYICPMVYPSQYGTDYWPIENVSEHPYDLVSMEINASNKRLKKVKEETGGYAAVCRPWLQAFSANGSKYDYGKIRIQVAACNDRDVYGFMYWNSSVYYEQEYFLTKEEEREQNNNRKTKSE